MKTYLILSLVLISALFLKACSQSPTSREVTELPNQQSFKQTLTVAPPLQGEKAIPTVEANLIKVNNKLCAVSRTPMDESTLGTFKGQVAYEGSNSKYRGKTFEFNYCCGMCQNMFPDKFKQDPDAILRFHGLL